MAPIHDPSDRVSLSYLENQLCLYTTHGKRLEIRLTCSDVFLAFPLTILDTLYWYTRQTSTGIHSFGSIIGGTTIIILTAEGLGRNFLSKTPWPSFLILVALSGFELATVYFQLCAVVPLERVWRGWVPGIRRVGWSKGERLTRRAEGQLGWVKQGIVSSDYSL